MHIFNLCLCMHTGKSIKQMLDLQVGHCLRNEVPSPDSCMVTGSHALCGIGLFPCNVSYLYVPTLICAYDWAIIV